MTILKAIVLDLDGTLLNGEGRISPQTKEKLLFQKEQGTEIILATGRPINMTVDIHKELQLQTPLICLNGAVTYDRQRELVLSYFEMEKHELDRAYETVYDRAKLLLTHTSHVNYQLKNDTGVLVEDYYPIQKLGQLPPANEKVLKLSAYVHDRDAANEAIQQLSPHYELADWNDCIEITKKHVTKWKALQEVLSQLHIHPSETIAFGDGPNDIEMIKNVGIGVAMGNAIPALKAVADNITAAHTEDGVMHFVEKYHKGVHQLAK